MQAGLIALGMPPPHPHLIGIAYMILAMAVTMTTYFVSFGR